MRSLPDAQRRFAAELPPVYRSNVLQNRTQALACAYPIVRKIVGEAFFEALARAYASAWPSRSGDLHEYGGAMSEFLVGFAPASDLPYLPDVARMEWCAHRAHFAADPPAFEARALERASPSASVTLAPACALLASSWPLARLWEVHQDDYRGTFQVDLAAGPDRVLVHRPRWRAEVRSLSGGDFAFLSACAVRAGLGEALEAAVAADADFQPEAALARWIDARVIVGLD